MSEARDPARQINVEVDSGGDKEKRPCVNSDCQRADTRKRYRASISRARHKARCTTRDYAFRSAPKRRARSIVVTILRFRRLAGVSHDSTTRSDRGFSRDGVSRREIEKGREQRREKRRKSEKRGGGSKNPRRGYSFLAFRFGTRYSAKESALISIAGF